MSLGLKRTVAKPHSAHPLGAMLGFRTQLSQQEQYSPNAFLEWMPFPMLCIPYANIPVHKAVLPGQVSGAATLHQDVTPAWFAGCHAGTLPFLGRNYMPIKPRATGTFQVPVSSPLFQCLTLSLRNLWLDCDFLTRK